MEPEQIRLPNAPHPRPEHQRGEVGPDGRQLADVLERRRAIHLDRYGLIDLAEEGLARADVFHGLYELIVTGRAEVKAAALGHLVLCHKPARAPAAGLRPRIARPALPLRERPVRARPASARAASPAAMGSDASGAGA